VKGLLKTGRQKIEDLHLQPIWNRTKEELQAAAKAIGRGTEIAAKKTIKMGKQAGIQYQVYVNHLKLQRSLAELGGRIYDLAKTNSSALMVNDPEAMALIKQGPADR
jgi:collagenase-like PrtC family protease